MNKLKKLMILVNVRIKSMWGVARLLPDYVRDILSQCFNSLPPNEKKILFMLKEDRLFRNNDNSGREAYQIMKAFSDSGGYNVYFYRPQDFKSYYRLRHYGRLIYGIKKLKFISRLPSNTQDFIYAFDTIETDILKLKWKKLLYVNIEKAPTYQIGNVIPSPYGMHPFIYAGRADQNIHEYREVLRKCRIFFGGNLHKDYYNDPIFKTRYPGYLSRLEGLETLINSDIKPFLISQKNNLDQLFDRNDYLKQMVIFRTDVSFPIKASDWLKTVSRSDFFMCFSGTSYPMCHNVIEAMAVGTIPIIAYSDWFEPELKHGENAIIYTDKEDLLKKVRAVLDMGPEEILRIRKGVLAYYDAYLTQEYLVHKYEVHAQEVSTLIRFPKFVLTEQDNNEGKLFVERFKQLNRMS